MTDPHGCIPNPYAGPRPLKEGDVLYGRDRERSELVDRVIADRIVVLHSPPAAGKTSLIRAGLIPALQDEELMVTPIIRVGAHDAETIAADGGWVTNRFVLSTLLSLEQTWPPEDQVPKAELANLDLPTYFYRRWKPQAGSSATVLIFDQFDEIVRGDPIKAYPGRRCKYEFFSQLGTLLADRTLAAVFAMQDTSVLEIDPLVRPIPTRLSNRFRLDPLSRLQASYAIGHPARQVGVTFANDAVDMLVDELARVTVERDGHADPSLGDYFEPLLLQLVCRRLWDRICPGTGESVIGLEEIQEFAQVADALRIHYAAAVMEAAARSGVREVDIRTWVEDRLIDRRGVPRHVLLDSGDGVALNRTAISALVDLALLRAESRRGDVWLELVSDRLVNPIRRDNATWFDEHLNPLQRRAPVWSHEGRPADLLLAGDTLAEMGAWAAVHGEQLSAEERELLEASRDYGRAQSVWRRFRGRR